MSDMDDLHRQIVRESLAATDIAQRRPTWTATPPTEPGFYPGQWRADYDVTVEELVWSCDDPDHRRLMLKGTWDAASEWHLWWPVPMTLPDPPEVTT